MDQPHRFTSEEILAVMALSKDATAIYTTEDLIIQAANDAMIGFWGKDRTVIGKSFIDAVPELIGQPFFDLLKEVWRTGVTYEAKDTPAQLKVGGKLQWFYYDFIYRAIKNEQGQVYCILHTATDVTDRHSARLAVQEGREREQNLADELTATNEELTAANEEIVSTNEELFQSQLELKQLNTQLEERVASRTNDFLDAQAEAERQRDRLTNFFMQAPAGICILDGPEMVYELINPLYQQLFPERELIGKPLLEALPELADSPVPGLLKEVYETGNTFEAHELLLPVARKHGGPLEDRYWDFIYQARRDKDNNVDGILVFVFEVTGMIKVQHDLRHARERSDQQKRVYETITSTTPDLMYVFDLNYRFTYANSALLYMWGKTWDDAVGKGLLENGYEPWHAEMHEREIDKVRATKQPIRGEVSFPHATLGTRFYDYIFSPVLNEHGEVEAVAGVTRDITERKQWEQTLAATSEELQAINEEMTTSNEELAATNEELAVTNEELSQAQKSLERSLRDYEQSEQRLRSLVESAPFPIGVYTGKEMRILLANQSIMDVWGKGNDVIGKLYSDILPELSNQEIFDQLDAVYTTGIPFHARNQRVDIVVDDKLQAFYFNYSFTPLFDAEGKVYGVMNTGAEVTDLQLALQQLAQNERNLHNMILQAPVAMCILMGPEHVIEVANERIIDLWGKPAKQVLNRPVFEALPDAREQGLEELMARVYEQGETFHASEMPVSLIRNGKPEVVYQNFVYQPYRGAEGAILGVIAITIDITEQVLARQKIERSEAELRETQKRLEKELEAGKLVQQQKDDFIGMASHELKTPLTSLGAIVQLAQLKLKNNSDLFLAGAMDKAHVQVRRMTAMINGFLNVSRLESGKLVIEKQPFDICALLQETISETALTSPAHTIHLNPCVPLQVNADREKIGSIVTNLLSNAVKYSPKGKQVEVNCTLIDSYVQVSVKDEGIGVEPKDLDKLFDRYYRVESVNTRHIAGFGIGLYLSAEIIRQHDGKIWVESEIGVGSTFYFSLPVGE